MQEHDAQPNRPNILVVDDDSDLVHLVSHHLTEAGYDVRTAGTGTEAFRIMLDEGPPIVIADWDPPGMSSLDLCRRIRQHEGIAYAYVLLVADAPTDRTQLMEAFQAGADGFLLKPIDPGELLARLLAAERNCRLHDALNRRTRDACRANAKLSISNEQLAELNKKLHEVAVTDELTGLPNRRQIIERIEHEWRVSSRRGLALSCVVIDIDHFKVVNDTYGHLTGDAVLRAVSRKLQASSRGDEAIGRLGGEEFLLICPQTTAEEAAVAAERLRRAVCDMQVCVNAVSIHVTISLGVADRTANMHNAEALLSRADAALYAAKDAGRNTVRVISSERAAGTVHRRPDSGPAAARPTDRDVLTVILADPDRSVRDRYRQWLEQDGYNIELAENGRQVVELVDARKPDIVVMEASMSDMDGFATARHLKAHRHSRAIPIIIVSGRGGAADVRAGLEAGADEYLTKPIQEAELLVRVRCALRMHREFQEANEIRGEQSRRLGLIADFTQSIVMMESRHDVLAMTMSAAAALIGSTRACFLRPNGNDSLGVDSTMGFSPEQLHDLRIPATASSDESPLALQDPLLLTSREDIARFAQSLDASICSFLPAVAAPLRVAGQTLGLLWLCGRHVRTPITATDLEYVRLIADISATTLHERSMRESRDEAQQSIVVGLAKLAEHRDPDTGKHLERVTRYCTLLAGRLAQTEKYRGVITKQFIQDLERAVPLHDIGKVAIPDRILLKPGDLDEHEFEIMQTHALIGAQTLRSVIAEAPGVRFLEVAEEIALGHHEWYDGNGYPSGLSGDAIPLAARIAAVADVYDAATTKRIYREAMSHDDAVCAITRSKGRQFDPDVVEAFVGCVEQFKELARAYGVDGETPPSSAQPQHELLTVGSRGTR